MIDKSELSEGVVTVHGSSYIELSNLKLVTTIGTYGSGDVVPDAHILDMKLEVRSDCVLINSDEMAVVFDYDPLIASILELAAERTYETQEYLMSLIVRLCAEYPEILSMDIHLSKTPVSNNTGQLGVRLSLDRDSFSALRGAFDT